MKNTNQNGESKMEAINARTENEAKKEAIEYSLKNKNKYITNSNTFGIFLHLQNSLNVFAPSDSFFKWYVLNGKVKNFTQLQKETDDLKTPILN